MPRCGMGSLTGRGTNTGALAKVCRSDGALDDFGSAFPSRGAVYAAKRARIVRLVSYNTGSHRAGLYSRPDVQAYPTRLNERIHETESN